MSVQNGLTITSANSVFLLGVTGVFPTAQQLQGFAADAAFATADIDMAEVMKGVDGNMSYGWLPQMNVQTISLQADSSSGFLFETWVQAENAAKEKMPCFAILTIPGLQRVYTLSNGVLSRAVPHPKAGKTMMPRDFVITWDKIVPAPIPG
jgi:hypothetical protein